MEIRSDANHFLLDNLVASETIDITTYDLCGRFTTDAKAALCGANETPNFLFMESASASDPVTVAFLGMGQVKLALSGTGSAGQKLSAAANGKIAASATAENAEMDEDDFGVALEDWTDGAETECLIYKGAKV